MAFVDILEHHHWRRKWELRRGRRDYHVLGRAIALEERTKTEGWAWD